MLLHMLVPLARHTLLVVAFVHVGDTKLFSTGKCVMAISALPATIVVGNGEYCQSPGPDHTTASGPGHFHANVRSTFCGPGRKHPIFPLELWPTRDRSPLEAIIIIIMMLCHLSPTVRFTPTVDIQARRCCEEKFVDSDEGDRTSKYSKKS
eukprot:3725473-Rhodomonas_salina.1